MFCSRLRPRRHRHRRTAGENIPPARPRRGREMRVCLRRPRRARQRDHAGLPRLAGEGVGRAEAIRIFGRGRGRLRPRQVHGGNLRRKRPGR